MVCLIVLYTCFYRVLVQLHSSYQNQKDLVTWHIPSKFSQEMSTKSTVVSIYTQYCVELFMNMPNRYPLAYTLRMKLSLVICTK